MEIVDHFPGVVCAVDNEAESCAAGAVDGEMALRKTQFLQHSVNIKLEWIFLLPWAG